LGLELFCGEPWPTHILVVSANEMTGHGDPCLVRFYTNQKYAMILTHEGDNLGRYRTYLHEEEKILQKMFHGKLMGQSLKYGYYCNNLKRGHNL
jgi:hypothetical protein